MMVTDWKVGDWVQSIKVGRKEPFNGQVTEVIETGRGATAYVLRCAENKRWHRSRHEVRPIPQKQTIH